MVTTYNEFVYSLTARLQRSQSSDVTSPLGVTIKQEPVASHPAKCSELSSTLDAPLPHRTPPQGENPADVKSETAEMKTPKNKDYSPLSDALPFSPSRVSQSHAFISLSEMYCKNIEFCCELPHDYDNYDPPRIP